MSGLRDRMNRLRGAGSEGPEGRTANVDEIAAEEHGAASGEEEDGREQLSPKWRQLGVELMDTEAGPFLLRKIVFPLSYKHGVHALDELVQAAAGLSAFHPKDEASAERILFLDLETTGLGIGAGNVPFMVGMACLTHNRFVVEQALIRHPAEERAMLAYLSDKLASFRYLATYNGKTFDWPVMQNRFIMNGFKRSVWEPLHLDFLHPARAVWKNTLVSCKLSHVEEERLGIVRQDDVPGSLAPQLYFEFLASGDPAPLEGVFRHNETDMLSLACLTIRFGHLLSEFEQRSFPEPIEPEEMVRTGLWLEKMGKRSLPERLFHAASGAESASPSTLFMLAERDKKAGNWMRAVLLWQKVIIHTTNTFGTTVQAACIELAMYYEHKIKDYATALQYAREALAHMSSHPLQRRDAKRSAELEAIRKRIARLSAKAERQGFGM